MTFNKKIIVVLALMLTLFCGVTLYFSYFQIFKSPALSGHSENPRTVAQEMRKKRGSVYDRDGEVLAKSEMTADGQKRVYPFNRLYSQLIGFSSNRYGRTLLEDTYNRYLLGGGADNALTEALFGYAGEKGADLHLTVEHDLQLLAANLLGDRRGSVVAMDPASGEILCMVSKPWFDANTISQNYETLSEEAGNFFPRATDWNYVPGSVFKIITAASALENGLENTEYEDTGTFTVDGYDIHNYGEKVYGLLDMDTAFSKSSNTYFASLATTLGEKALRETAKNFYFGREIPFDIPVRKSTTLTGHPTATDVAAVGYGQGDTEVTPLHMAMITSAIANDGVMMAPYVVKSAEADGSILYKKESRILNRAVSVTTARRIADMMEKCASEGTAAGVAIPDITVCAKTGTAEVGEGQKDHAWFVAYAPRENPEIAVSIVLENAGTTGSACAYMAKSLISSYLQ